jgi:hypothetical protein
MGEGVVSMSDDASLDLLHREDAVLLDIAI